MAIGLILICLLLTILIVYVEVRKFFSNRKMGYFELINGAPFLGVITRCFRKSDFEMNNMILNFFDEAKTTAFRLWFGFVLVFGTTDPKIVEILLTHESSVNKPFIYKYFHCRTSIIAADNEIWKPNRRALNPAFTVSALLNQVPYLNEKAHILIDRMRSCVKKPGDLHRTISVCMMDIITKTMLGVDMNLQSERGERIFEMEKKLMNGVQYRIPRIWLQPDFIYYNFTKVGRQQGKLKKIANEIIEQIYEKKVQELKLQNTSEPRAQNFLEKCLQLERQGILSHRNVMDELRVVLIAGVDTSTITLFATLLMLAINQRHQEMVVDELRSIFESVDCDVTQTHLVAMNYTERVIKESMRLLTPAPIIARQSNADIDLPNGTLPKNTIAVISAMHMHRNPQIWGENALEFDPDRFLPDNIEKRPPFSYIPFSAGPRNCIGMKYSMMSVKTVLAHLLRKYRFETDLKFEDIELYMHIVLDIANENPFRIEERDF